MLEGNSALANLGSGATQASSLYVNASTGNLILQNLDEKISGMGADLQYLRTYNSQGQLNGQNQGNWRHVGERNLIISGTLGESGSEITRIAADGSLTAYSFDEANNSYVSSAGSGAHDKISVVTRGASSALQWLEGSTHVAEYYNVTTGQLFEQEDSNGNVVRYIYDSEDRLSQILDAGTIQYIQLQYNSDDRIESIATISESSGNLIRQVHYEYDSATGRLEAVEVDLTPEDNTIADSY